MAISAAALIKIGLTVLSNDKARKGIGWIIFAILSPIIVAIALVLGVMSGATSHNNDVIDVVFGGGKIQNATPEYELQIETMQNKFAEIDSLIAGFETSENSFDDIQIKAVFFSLFFADVDLSKKNIADFLANFYTFEEKTRTVKTEDEDGNEIIIDENYNEYSYISDMGIVFKNIENAYKIDITTADKSNISEIYYRVKFGEPAPTSEGDDFDKFAEQLPLSDVPFVGIESAVSPVSDWKNCVSSDYGYRIHPIKNSKQFHKGIDIAKPAGSEINTILDGKVVLVRYSETGYGYHLIVDHGGGITSLYAHCSEILVDVGQEISAGEQIAKVGTTGDSTGNHLHFEVRKDGENQDPKGYLK